MSRLAGLRRSTIRGCLAAATLALAVGTASAGPDDALACDQAGAATEAALSLPPGLLRAIGRVESGRRNPASGSFAPWPWTINANGQGRFFDDAASAAAAVRGLQASGTASIDIGCFQVNLMHHPLAFSRVEDGFEPRFNAAYAGAFLQSLRQRHGNWEAAVAAYHSATAERGDAYRARVYAVWNPAGGDRGIAAAALPAVRPAGPVVIRIAGPDLSAPDSVIRVWTPSGAGTAPARIAMPAPMVPATMMPTPITSEPVFSAPAPGGAIRVADADDIAELLGEAVVGEAVQPRAAPGLPVAAMLPAALVAPVQEMLLPAP